MTGMEMMLKQFGIDPVKIKAELQQTLDGVSAMFKSEIEMIKASQKRIEEKLDLVLRDKTGEFDSSHDQGFLDHPEPKN